MQFHTHLDLNVIAVDMDSTVSVLLELTAPMDAAASDRAPAALEIVLDRSGSMAGAPLNGAKTALLALLDRLDPRDRFGLVTFDDQARIAVAATQLTDKAAVRQAIQAIEPGGMTDLAAGYLTGLQQARGAATATGATLVLISDGHANSGETNPDILGSVAHKARAEGVTTSALGYGLNYDERLLAAIASAGGGNESFAEDPDAAGKVIAGEVSGLLSQAAQATTLLVSMSPDVRGVRVVNDLPPQQVDQGIQLLIGRLYCGETRKVVLTFDIPGLAALGLLQVAELTLSWVALPALEQHTVTIPVHVNVVPGDEAAGRIPNPVVRTELAYLEVQLAKRDASTLLSQGDVDSALAHLRAAEATLLTAMASAPPELRGDLDQEAIVLSRLVERAAQGDVRWSARMASADSSMKGRYRGHRGPGES